MSDRQSILTPVFRTRLRAWFARNPVSAMILVACLGIEAALEGADAGLWGATDWRDTAYTYGAFWGGMLHGQAPAYALQPFLMFLSYGVLHGGFWHVTLNMLTLVSLGAPVAARLGQARYLLLYVLANIGGGAGFLILSYTEEPMLGASGALFGLAGAILAWVWVDHRRAGHSLALTASALTRPIFYLITFNVVFYFATNGALAWGAHLGGFLTGWVLALAMDRPRYRRFTKTRS